MNKSLFIFVVLILIGVTLSLIWFAIGYTIDRRAEAQWSKILQQVELNRLRIESYDAERAQIAIGTLMRDDLPGTPAHQTALRSMCYYRNVYGEAWLRERGWSSDLAAQHTSLVDCPKND